MGLETTFLILSHSRGPASHVKPSGSLTGSRHPRMPVGPPWSLTSPQHTALWHCLWYISSTSNSHILAIIPYGRLVGDPQEIVSWLLSQWLSSETFSHTIYNALLHREGLEMCEALTLFSFIFYLRDLKRNGMFCCVNWLNDIYHNIKRWNRIIFSPMLPFKALNSAQIISV